jgi:hypothetical protein
MPGRLTLRASSSLRPAGYGGQAGWRGWVALGPGLDAQLLEVAGNDIGKPGQAVRGHGCLAD